MVKYKVHPLSPLKTAFTFFKPKIRTLILNVHISETSHLPTNHLTRQPLVPNQGTPASHCSGRTSTGYDTGPRAPTSLWSQTRTQGSGAPATSFTCSPRPPPPAPSQTLARAAPTPGFTSEGAPTSGQQFAATLWVVLSRGSSRTTSARRCPEPPAHVVGAWRRRMVGLLPCRLPHLLSLSLALPRSSTPVWPVSTTTVPIPPLVMPRNCRNTKSSTLSRVVSSLYLYSIPNT